MAKILINLVLLVSTCFTTWGVVCITPAVWQAGTPEKLAIVTLWLGVGLTWWALLRVFKEVEDDSK